MSKAKVSKVTPYPVMPGIYCYGDVYYGIGNEYLHNGKRVRFVQPETDGVNHFMMLQASDAGGYLLPSEKHSELTPIIKTAG